MLDEEGYSFYTFLECLGDILEYKQELWLCLIIDALWRKYKLCRNKNKEIRKFLNTLTFRLVIAMPWLRNLLLGNVFVETFGIRIGSTDDTFLAGKDVIAYLCPYLDLWASCRIYLYMCTIILELCDKFKRFHAHIYLYIYINPIVFGCPVSGHRTPWLSQLNCILWFIFHQKRVFDD